MASTSERDGDDGGVAAGPERDVPVADEATGAARRLQKLVDRSSDVIVVVDVAGRVTWISPAVEKMIGVAPESLIGKSAASFIHADDLSVAADQMTSALAATDGQPVTLRSMNAAGEWRHLRVTASDFTDDPDIEGLVFSVADVTDEVEARRSSQRLSTALELSPDLVITLTRSGEVWMNRAASTLLGMAEAPHRDVLLDRTPLWARHRITHEIGPALLETGSWEGELALLDREGELVPLSVVAVGLSEASRIDIVTVIARDISERKAFEDQLEHQATHDPLTGLPNRTLLLDRLRVAVGRAARQRTVAAILFLDLDNFKTINDGLGHSAGDQLLRQVSRRIESAVRPGDTVARFGGDEFAVLCEDLPDRDEAVAIALRIEAALARPVVLDTTEVTATVSIGVATSDGDQDAESLMRDSDAAMYQAKARGRSRTEVFDAAMHVQAVDRLELETGLRRALERHEIAVVYQPQVDLESGRVTGVECLVRWDHPERGVLVPADFLTIAEETGLIVPIGGWVMSTAARALARVRDLHPEAAEGLVMSVNISARQLGSPRLIDDVAAIVSDAELAPGSLMLEVTESDLMDVDVSSRALADLQALGVRVSVDDFGTGWSSLRYLRQFPVDVLKIDRSFVAGLGRDSEDEVIVAAVIDLAHALGLSAVAEGVETDVHLQRLRELGCDAAQGWLIGRPMCEPDLIELLAAGPTEV